MAGPATNTVVITNDGSLADINAFLGTMNLGTVRLFTNNYTPVHTSVPSSFVEAAYVGYVPQVPSYGPAFLNGFGQAETDSAPLTWTFTAGAGSVTIFGWYLLDSTGTKVLWGEKFVLPITLTPASPSFTRVSQITEVSAI